MSISRQDIDFGRVPPKVIENGVISPPGLQVNILPSDPVTVPEEAREVPPVASPSQGEKSIGQGGEKPPQTYASVTRDAFNRIAPARMETAPEATGFDKMKARTMGYTGDVCTNIDCGSVKIKRNGSCLLCEDCGMTTGCS